MREGAGNKAASQSLIDPGVEAQSYFCSVCGNGHDFKSRSHLNQHEKSASHKRKIDPEFAAVEEAEKAAEKATNKTARDTKETDRLKKRRRTKAEKQLASRKNQKRLYAKLNEKNTTPPITETGTEEDVLSALVCYHGSTSAMLLHDDDVKIKSNIEQIFSL